MNSDKIFHLLCIGGLLAILASCATSGPAAASEELSITDVRPLEKCTNILSEPSTTNYPQTIEPEELEGEATVTMTINREGNAEDISVEESTDSQLSKTVVDELEQLKFTPVLCGDFPVPVQVTVLFAF